MAQFYPDLDDKLWQQIRAGSAEAFNVLYEKYWETIYSNAFKRLKNHGQAQDITQDIFTNLWLKKENLHIENVGAYLHISVRNRVLNLFEKEKRYVPIEQLLENNVRLYGDRTDAAALRNEFLNAYKNLVNTLPAQRKKIFTLHYDECLSTDEIASQLQLSRKTIQNQLGRAVSFLKTNLSHLFLLCIIFWL